MSHRAYSHRITDEGGVYSPHKHWYAWVICSCQLDVCNRFYLIFISQSRAVKLGFVEMMISFNIFFKMSHKLTDKHSFVWLCICICLGELWLLHVHDIFCLEPELYTSIIVIIFFSNPTLGATWYGRLYQCNLHCRFTLDIWS